MKAKLKEFVNVNAGKIDKGSVAVNLMGTHMAKDMGQGKELESAGRLAVASTNWMDRSIRATSTVEG